MVNQYNGQTERNRFEKSQVQDRRAEVFLQFKGEPNGIVQFDESTDDKQRTH